MCQLEETSHVKSDSSFQIPRQRCNHIWPCFDQDPAYKESTLQPCSRSKGERWLRAMHPMSPAAIHSIPLLICGRHHVPRRRRRPTALHPPKGASLVGQLLPLRNGLIRGGRALPDGSGSTQLSSTAKKGLISSRLMSLLLAGGGFHRQGD